MASSLVLRLCQVNEDDGGVPEDQHIAINDFVEGLFSILGGYHTVVQMKTFYNMTAAEQTTFDTLVSLITSAPNLTKQIGRIHRIRSILTFWERRDDLNLTAYDTPDDIQTQLLDLESGFL